MIRFESVTMRYPDSDAPTLANVDLQISEAELCLVVGRTGTGKTTLLKAINGLFPHFTGGTLTGRITVAGRSTADHLPREFADVIGMVGQDPNDGFVTDIVEEELAYGMESLGLAGTVMRRRVEETLDILGLVDLRHRALSTLSGGERQRVAIGSVLTTHPSVLVLDEPTSALDPPAADEVLAVLQRLVHDLGLTVVLAEHRLERVVHLADTMVHLTGVGQPIEVGTPADIMATSSVAPPVIELGRLAGWHPLPLSVRDARRRATGLTTDLRTRRAASSTENSDRNATSAGLLNRASAAVDRKVVGQIRGLTVAYGGKPVLHGIDLDLLAGQVMAVMGRNGAGKSSLLRAIVGATQHQRGTVSVTGHDPATLPAHRLVRTVGLVPQDPSDLLYAESVDAECAAADRDAGTPAGTCRGLVEQLMPSISGSVHPRDLSEGQRLILVLAIVMTGSPALLLLDEPTRGLDYPSKRTLTAILQDLVNRGHAVVVATHDVEFAATASDRTIVLADGEIVVDGPTAEVVVASPAFAPQIAKILAPLPLLTVDDVRALLEDEVA
ncbi:MAG: ATP-binding cassette domain-containing protein [Nitriliruptoraceae bacterium]